MKTYGGVDMQIHVFVTSALVEVSGQLHAPAILLPGNSPHYPLRRGWVGTRTGPDEAERRMDYYCVYTNSLSIYIYIYIHIRSFVSVYCSISRFWNEELHNLYSATKILA
jgi:hypothetical protein